MPVAIKMTTWIELGGILAPNLRNRVTNTLNGMGTMVVYIPFHFASCGSPTRTRSLLSQPSLREDRIWAREEVRHRTKQDERFLVILAKVEQPRRRLPNVHGKPINAHIQ